MCIYVHIYACLLSWFSHLQLFVTLWSVTCQSHLSMGFSRHECWSGLPRPPPWDLPDPSTEPTSLTCPALAASSLPLVPPGKSIHTHAHITDSFAVHQKLTQHCNSTLLNRLKNKKCSF